LNGSGAAEGVEPLPAHWAVFDAQFKNSDWRAINCNQSGEWNRLKTWGMGRARGGRGLTDGNWEPDEQVPGLVGGRLTSGLPAVRPGLKRRASFGPNERFGVSASVQNRPHADRRTLDFRCIRSAPYESVPLRKVARWGAPDTALRLHITNPTSTRALAEISGQ
jgi:hypothetical protein